MPRKKKLITNQTPLAKFIEELIRDRGLTAKRIAQDCGVAQSVIASWRAGADAADASAVRRLANRYDRTLSSVLTGQEDQIASHTNWDRVPLFDGLCEISIKRLIPRKAP